MTNDKLAASVTNIHTPEHPAHWNDKRQTGSVSDKHSHTGAPGGTATTNDKRTVSVTNIHTPELPGGGTAMTNDKRTVSVTNIHTPELPAALQ